MTIGESQPLPPLSACVSGFPACRMASATSAIYQPQGEKGDTMGIMPPKNLRKPVPRVCGAWVPTTTTEAGHRIGGDEEDGKKGGRILPTAIVYLKVGSGRLMKEFHQKCHIKGVVCWEVDEQRGAYQLVGTTEGLDYMCRNPCVITWHFVMSYRVGGTAAGGCNAEQEAAAKKKRHVAIREDARTVAEQWRMVSSGPDTTRKEERVHAKAAKKGGKGHGSHNDSYDTCESGMPKGGVYA